MPERHARCSKVAGTRDRCSRPAAVLQPAFGTTDLDRPRQSYRLEFPVRPEWQSLRLPFADFVPHRTDAPFNLARLRRLGIVAIGRAFTADLALSGVRFYG